MKAKVNGDIGVEVERSYMVTINGLRRKMGHEQVLKLHQSLGAALGHTRVPAPAHTDLEATEKPDTKYGPWSGNDVQFLKSMHKAGRPPENIAMSIKRSAESVRKKLAELEEAGEL